MVTVHVYKHSVKVTKEEVHMEQVKQRLKELQQLQQMLRFACSFKMICLRKLRLLEVETDESTERRHMEIEWSY